MKRVTFDPSRDMHAEPQQSSHNPRNCAAHGCRLAGDGSDLSDARERWCSYHRMAPMHAEIPVVTDALRKHGAVVDVIRDGQHLLNRRPFETGLHAQFWQVNREALEQMGYLVEPAKRPTWDNCEGWLYRVRSMLGKLVREELNAARKVPA